jgi:hypothetical protein
MSYLQYWHLSASLLSFTRFALLLLRGNQKGTLADWKSRENNKTNKTELLHTVTCISFRVNIERILPTSWWWTSLILSHMWQEDLCSGKFQEAQCRTKFSQQKLKIFKQLSSFKFLFSFPFQPWNISCLLTYFPKVGLCYLHAVSVSVNPLIDFWMPVQMFVKLGMYIMTPELISTAYTINPSHQSVCLYVYPHIVTSQRLGKLYPSIRC